MDSSLDDEFAWSWDDEFAWSAFILRRRLISRHALSKDEQKFLDRILNQADERKMHFAKGHEFIRARIGSAPKGKSLQDLQEKIPYPKEELKPSPQKIRSIKDGRANPRGITVLYLADSIETAVAEVRPWISAYVTIGTLKLNKDITVVNLYKDFPPSLFSVSDPVEEKIWEGINKSFAKPVSHGDEMWDYYATQYLAESFKLKGYDGILYMSSQYDGGYNVALFNIDDASVISTKLIKISSVLYNFDHIK